MRWLQCLPRSEASATVAARVVPGRRAAANGYAGMRQEDAGDRREPGMRHYLDPVRESTRHMGMLMDELLAFARPGRKPIDRLPIALNGRVRRALQHGQGSSPAGARGVVGGLPPTCAGAPLTFALPLVRPGTLPAREAASPGA